MRMTITQTLAFLVFSLFLLTACAATVQPGSTGAPTVDSSPATEEPSAIPTPTREAPPPSGAEREFRTDFSRHSVDYSEILSGGPPKDGIPALDHPQFISVDQADGWLQPQEPVILVHIGDDARAYPLQVLVWHEIVNDVVDGVPGLVTFCPHLKTCPPFLLRANEAGGGRLLVS